MNEKDTANDAIIRTFWNIYDGVFLQKQLAASSPLLFSQKTPIIDIWYGSKYVSELLKWYLLLEW